MILTKNDPTVEARDRLSPLGSEVRTLDAALAERAAQAPGNGGEPVRQSTILAFEERFGVPGVLRPGYGLAEATLGVTCLRQGEPLRIDARGNVSCGRPLPGVEVRLDQCVPGLRIAAAVGLPPVPDGSTEEIAVAVEADPAAEPLQVAADVTAAIEEALGFSPDQVVVLAPGTIPRTANGKIRHPALRRELIDGDLERRGAVLLSAPRSAR